MSGEERYLTTAEVAAVLRVSPTCVAGWARQGKLPAVRVGRRWLILRSGIEAVQSKVSGGDRCA